MIDIGKYSRVICEYKNVSSEKYILANEEDDKIFKKVFKPGYKENYEQERDALIKLIGKSHTPELVHLNDRDLTVWTTYCGEPLTIENTPDNWRKQIGRIGNHLESVGIYHNDIHVGNFLVKGGTIYLIDYERAMDRMGYACWNFSRENLNRYGSVKDLCRNIMRNGAIVASMIHRR